MKPCNHFWKKMRMELETTFYFEHCERCGAQRSSRAMQRDGAAVVFRWLVALALVALLLTFCFVMDRARLQEKLSGEFFLAPAASAYQETER